MASTLAHWDALRRTCPRLFVSESREAAQVVGKQEETDPGEPSEHRTQSAPSGT